MKTQQYPMGTVSQATMRLDDLIPVFLYELKTRRRVQGPKKEYTAELHAIEQRSSQDGYYTSEDADYDLEWLFDALDSYAAPYFYFGAHPGDGADYGYWLSENWDDDFVSFGAWIGDPSNDHIKVDDLSDIPAKYRGEVALVNDHGNVTLYVKTARKLTEVWAVV